MLAYYNELDPYPAQWLRNLTAAGHITPGTIDEKDIRDVQPNELIGYNRCHFFAGLGLWDYALGLAGWGDAEVWTGSCPCQPWSTAGKRGGANDPRHLWPAWFELIRQRRPRCIFGEQVASKDALAWLDLVYADLEGAGYAVAAVDLCAAGAGAPHVRQRLYFVAHPEGGNGRLSIQQGESRQEGIEFGGRSKTTGILGDAEYGGRGGGNTQKRTGTDSIMSSGKGGFWSDVEWLPCREPDGTVKYRPTKPGLFPLADGYIRRVAKLRAIGNSIVPQVAAEFIRAYMELSRD